MALSADILAPVGGDFGPAATLELIAVGGGCGAVGVWLVRFGRAFLAESFTHALLPGLVAASLLGASLLVGAVAGLVVAYMFAVALQRTPKTSPAAASSVMVTSLVAAGALMATNNSGSVAFEALLFGNPIAASTQDVAVGIALAALIAAALIALHSRFAALAFDPGAARSLGVNVGATTAAMLALLVVSIAVASNVAGSLLALALVTGPALGALSASRRVSHALVLAAGLGAACGVGGIYLSYYADWPASACVALLACFVALAPSIAIKPLAAR